MAVENEGGRGLQRRAVEQRVEVLLSSGDDGDPNGKERRDFVVSGNTTRASEAPSSLLA